MVLTALAALIHDLLFEIFRLLRGAIGLGYRVYRVEIGLIRGGLQRFGNCSGLIRGGLQVYLKTFSHSDLENKPLPISFLSSGLVFLLHSGLPFLSSSGLAEQLRSGLSLVAVYRTDFASWQQRIRLYYWGKENGVNILKLIDKGPFQMRMFRETLAEEEEGALHLGPEGPQVYSDLSPEEMDQYNANIRATNILLQVLPKYIYTLINYYTNHKGETIHDYYVRFAKLINDMRNIKMTMSRMQLNSKFVNNMLPEWDRFITLVKLNRGLRDSNYDQLYAYLKQHEYYLQSSTTLPSTSVQENGVALYEEQLLFIAGEQDNVVDEDMDEQPVQDLALNTMFMANLSSPSYDSDILSENKVAIGYKNPLYLTHTQQVQPALYSGNEIIKTNHVPAIVHNSEKTLEIAEITRKKMNDKMNDPKCVQKKVKIEPHDYSKENYLTTFTPHKQLTPKQIFWSKDLLKTKTKALKEQTIASKPIKALTVFSDMHEALNAAQKRIAELKFENFNLQKRFKMMVTIGNTICDLRDKISRLTKKHSDAVPTHDLKALDSQNKELHAKVNTLHDLNDRWWAENEKVKRHYQELYDSIKVTRAKTIKKTNSLLTEVANLKAQIQENHISNCVTMPAVKAKVLAPCRYAIDIKPIPSRIRNNWEVHLDYLKHLKKSVETLREIVEDVGNKMHKAFPLPVTEFPLPEELPTAREERCHC
nr:integrase, catalytic region, zinc finger, CCHC-type, peptidase aspartic, catalytic [Tanacetum cinerariifolium]